jgi:dihydrolipoamide dehydrogenase
MKKNHKNVVVLGAGPGGYSAAFYLADHGYSVTLIEQDAVGGVCLNRGCIPSKALLNVAGLIDKAKKSQARGVQFSAPIIDVDALKAWKNGVIGQLQSGIQSLARARGVEVIQGRAAFEDNQTIRVELDSGQDFLTFDYAIIATGSRPIIPPVMDLGNPRIMTSTEALELADIPQTLLVVGGGYIGMELGSVYASLGSAVSVVEALPTILAGADTDLVKRFTAHVSPKMTAMYLAHSVKSMATKGKQIEVVMATPDGDTITHCYDKVLVSVGRRPNSDNMSLDNTTVSCDDKGFVTVNANGQTSVPTIYAIGDVAGGVQLAHKATKEAKIVAHHILNEPSIPLKELVIPAVVYTDPEIAWVGITEKEAREGNTPIQVTTFPWAANGRSLTMDASDGITKIIADPGTGRVLGVGIVGEHAGDLISEAALAVQSGMTVDDLAETIHPHPTLSETLMEAAEHALGVCTHLPPKK